MTQRKISFEIDIAPNARYCGYCVYKGTSCKLFKQKLHVESRDCYLRCETCLKGELK